MKPRLHSHCAAWACRSVLLWWVATLGAGLAAGQPAELGQQLNELRKQNELMQQQLRQQQELIERLNRKVATLETATSHLTNEAPVAPPPPEAEARKEGLSFSPLRIGNTVLSGEAGVALFHSGSRGQSPNTEFRVDEAKLFLEAQVWRDVFFFTELNLAQREDQEDYFRLGELYVEAEGLLKPLGHERLLNLRVGRLDIPFGEDYLRRDAIDNPLISHSLSDLWGVDEGVELYGSAGRFQYVLAVQNGGRPVLRDYDADKAVVGRLGYDPAKWLHLSVSGMRTGNLNVADDKMSELWFGNGFVRALGPAATTTTFGAELVEGDAQWRWKRGHLATAGGYLHSHDNDRAAPHPREVYYYYVEGIHYATEKLYGAARVSQIFSPRGFPLVGNGSFGNYFFRELTKDLWRVSLGGGYRWSPHFVVKAEYTFNGGETLSGASRPGEDFLAVEAAVGF